MSGTVCQLNDQNITGLVKKLLLVKIMLKKGAVEIQFVNGAFCHSPGFLLFLLP